MHRSIQAFVLVTAAASLLATLTTPPVSAHPPERIPRAACEAAAFDFTDRFGPDAIQGNQGQCFAFVAAALSV